MFKLDRRARVLVTVYGPGPACRRVGTFTRRGHAGVNRVTFSGTLFGRALAPGVYAIVVEITGAPSRVRIGRVLVQILPKDGREGGSRPLAAPDCDGGSTALLASFPVGGGDFGTGTATGDPSAASAASLSSSGNQSPGGVAGVAAGRDDDGPLPALPSLPALPPLPAGPFDGPVEIPSWALPALFGLAGFGATILVMRALRRRREYAGWD